MWLMFSFQPLGCKVVISRMALFLGFFIPHEKWRKNEIAHEKQGEFEEFLFLPNFFHLKLHVYETIWSEFLEFKQNLVLQ